MEQHMLALGKAKAVRSRKARVLRELRAGRISLAEALADPALANADVTEAMLALPRVGRRTAARVIDRAGIRTRKPVRELTERQLLLIVEALDG